MRSSVTLLFVILIACGGNHGDPPLDASVDAPAAVCGDGTITAPEACDGAASCASTAYPEGQLSCATTCTATSDAFCHADTPGRCGDGVNDGGFESCDGADLPSTDCRDYFGGVFTGGTVSCTSGCTLDFRGCTGDSCAALSLYGDGRCDPCELLGGTRDPDCASCAADGTCASYLDWITDSTTCVWATGAEDPDCGSCGDGVVAPDEWCDGGALRAGLDCTSFGYASGTLACDAGCKLDFSGCSPAPFGWTCDPAKYGAGDGCDCGCGVIDADCADGLGSSCTTCNDAGSCSTDACPGSIDPSDNTRCLMVPPVGWRCLGDYYFDADCDCGCGVPDPACADATVASCAYCDDPGSCSTSACPGNIAASDNATCTLPPEWTCDPAKYGAGDGCDCGCGGVDPDCTGDVIASCTTCDACGTSGCPGNVDPGDITRCSP